MASILKVDTIQDQDGNNIINESAGTITIGKSGDTVQVASGAEFVGGGTQWQSSIVTGTTLSAVAGNGYWIDTTSNACTVTLPGSASVGDTIEFSDYARNWGTNNVTINPNSLNFQGNSSPNAVYDVDGQSVRIVYSGATKGWIPTSDDDVTLETPQTITTDFLVIAGGGGGGFDRGGGGGAGGYRNSYSTESSGGGGSSETALELSAGTVYTITVGSGGAGATGGTPGGNGNDSSISGSDITTITSTGGGGAGSNNSLNGQNGGSGGGRAYGGTPGSGTANQGFDGGASSYPGAPGYDAAGGGGAGEAGDTDGDKLGGDGLSSSITGSAVLRGGGGGGYASTGGGGAGGDGGGGAASSSDGANNAGSGTVNTGGGGGGGDGSTQNGASGGSGVVILRLPTADYTGTTTGSPTVGTDGTDTILTFTASGSYTA